MSVGVYAATPRALRDWADVVPATLRRRFLDAIRWLAARDPRASSHVREIRDAAPAGGAKRFRYRVEGYRMVFDRRGADVTIVAFREKRHGQRIYDKIPA